MRILTSYMCRSVQRVVRAVRHETTREILGLAADPDESPENSYAAVRAIFARDDFNDARRAHKTYVNSGGERGRHIKLGTPYFLGHQVDGSEDKLFTAVASVWPFYDTSQVFRTHAHLRRVVFPTQQYVEHMRDKFFDWTENVLSGAERFLDVCIKKKATGSMKEYIRLAEDFILCEALETKWSVEVRHKCSCPLFFRKGQCEHDVLLAMLAAPTEV